MIEIIKRKDGNEKRDREEKRRLKEQEKRRKKMLKSKYGRRELPHAKKGVNSCAIAAGTWVLLFLFILLSYHAKGDINILYGFAGYALPVLAIWGLRMGRKGLKEREKNYITCKIGLCANGLMLFAFAALFIRGLM